MNKGIIKKIYRVKDIEIIQSKINMLGNSRKFKFDAVDFLSLRLITTILLTIILLFWHFLYIINTLIIINIEYDYKLLNSTLYILLKVIYNRI
jgi:hypothetical protein